MNESRLILLDRDGTLIVEKDYLSDPSEVELIEGAASAIRVLRERGHKIALISNQSGVARGYFDIETVNRVHDRLQRLLVQAGTALDAVYFCPHGPKDECLCRKPGTGMLEDASRDLNLPLQNAVVAGDKAADIEAGKAVQAFTVLVRTGYGQETETKVDLHPDAVINSLADLPDLL